MRALATLALAMSLGCVAAPRVASPPVPESLAAFSPLADSLLAADAARTDSVARLGYVDGMMSTLTPDVTYLRAGQPMTFGQVSVRRLLASAAPAAGAVLRWQAVRVGVSRDGNAAYTVGIAANAGTALRLDRYLAYWRREPDGAWRIAAYAEMGPPPAAAPAIDDAGRPRALNGARDSLFRVLAATDSAFSARCVQSGSADSFGEFAAPDAIVSGGGRFVVGPRAIHELHAGPDGGALSWRAVAGDVATSADLGFTVGEYTFAPSDGKASSHGKYLTIWTSQMRGVWRFVADGGNANPPR